MFETIPHSDCPVVHWWSWLYWPSCWALVSTRNGWNYQEVHSHQGSTWPGLTHTTNSLTLIYTVLRSIKFAWVIFNSAAVPQPTCKPPYQWKQSLRWYYTVVCLWIWSLIKACTTNTCMQHATTTLKSTYNQHCQCTHTYTLVTVTILFVGGLNRAEDEQGADWEALDDGCSPPLIMDSDRLGPGTSYIWVYG